MSVPAATVERMIAISPTNSPGPWPDTTGTDPPPTPANTLPTGLLALELDHATAIPDHLRAADLLDAVIGYQHLIAWATARQYALMATFHTRPADGTVRPAAHATDPTGQSPAQRAWAADEIGLALTLAPGAADTLTTRADRLADALRPTRDLLETGRICPDRARLITDLLAPYDDPTATAVQTRVLPKAPGQTRGQLRAAITRALHAVVPDPQQRHQKARRQRRVELYPGPDGMATLSAYLTAAEATASFEWVTRLARGLHPDTGHSDGGDSSTNGSGGSGAGGSGRGRGSMDRRRADVLAALLTGRLTTTTDTATAAAAIDADPTGASPPTTGQPQRVAAAPVSAHRPLIHVTVPITTLMGLDDEPAHLTGHGPLPAPVAREIAADPTSTWRRLLTDPATGQLLDLGHHRYRPPTALAGFVRARDGHCRYPGCSRPATACELDHVIARQHHGTTSEDNLCSLCERHHDLKHSGWHVLLRPDRTCVWTTPTGHRYTSHPVDHRADRPQHPPPPDNPQPTNSPQRTPVPATSTATTSPDPDPPPF